MSRKKSKKTVSALPDAKSYRNAIARLNYVRGVKPGDKNYITPSQALNDFRKYSSVEKIEAQISKQKNKKMYGAAVNEYNKYQQYKKGDAGYLTVEDAQSIGLSTLIDITEGVKRQNYDKVKTDNRYQRNVKESLRDEQKLKEKASRILIKNNYIMQLADKRDAATTAQEYQKYENEIRKQADSMYAEFQEYANEERKIRNKWKKRNKLPLENQKELTLDRIKQIPNTSISEQLERMLNDSKRDRYGNPMTFYAMYRNQVTNTVSSILDATLNTRVEIDGNEYVLSDVIYMDKIDNKKFWNAFHAWEKDGGIVVSKNGRKYPDYISAANFFTTPEGEILLDSLLTSEYAGANVRFID